MTHLGIPRKETIQKLSGMFKKWLIWLDLEILRIMLHGRFFHSSEVE